MHVKSCYVNTLLAWVGVVNCDLVVLTVGLEPTREKLPSNLKVDASAIPPSQH